jgi:hypothetical protein
MVNNTSPDAVAGAVKLLRALSTVIDRGSESIHPTPSDIFA